MIEVRAENISVTIADKPILSNVSITARPGEITALIGPNGAGKSTLLSALSGDLKLTSGASHLGSMDVSAASAKELSRLRSVMLQDTSVAFSFLVRDVVEMGRRPWAGSVSAEQDSLIVDAALHATNMTHLQARDSLTLSGGERARMAMSRVLAQRTPVVFLDEPTAAMDIRHQEQTLGLARRLAQGGATVIVVLHDLNAAAAYADHVVCLSQGKVVSDGTVREVYTSENLSEIYGWPIDVVELESGRMHVSPRDGHEESHADPAQLDVLLGGYS